MSQHLSRDALVQSPDLQEPPLQRQTAQVTMHVCVTCRAGQSVSEGEACAGQRLLDAVVEKNIPDGVRVEEVKCLSACSRGPVIALASPGRWTYVYGNLGPGDVAEMLSGAQAYGASPDGVVPWKERVQIYKKNTVARIPPLSIDPTPMEPVHE